MGNKLNELETTYGGKLTPNGMIDRDYKDRIVRFFRFAGAHCPICGKNHWCQINVTGTKVVCQDEGIVPDKKETFNGFKYLYTIKKINGKVFQLVDSKNAVRFDPATIKKLPSFKLTSASKLDVMNRLVLAAYRLNKEHRADLKKRGLTDSMINLHADRGFGSYYVLNKDGKAYFTEAKTVIDSNGNKHFISRWDNAIKRLGLPSNIWHGVPGFYDAVIKSHSRIIAKVASFSTGNGKHTPEGMLIPYYDEYNRIQSFQVRIDKPRKYAVIKQSLVKNQGELKVYINSDDTYRVYYQNNDHTEKIAEGKLNGRRLIELTYGYDVMEEHYSFEVKQSAKYFWVSSRYRYNGADNDGKVPVQVAYNPTIAALNPNNLTDRKILNAYIKKPKAIWVTEGGLKGYIAACNLQNAFNSEELVKYGQDVLAVAGVNSYHKFIPLLKRLNVHTVTIAYDMDMLNNDQVADNYAKLVNLLHENEYKVQYAAWDPTRAKGIDDALASSVDIIVSE